VKHSRVTVNIINKNKSLKGTKDIFRVMEQATRILNECSYPPSMIVEHVFDDRLTAIEIEFISLKSILARLRLRRGTF
jgi:hypothetical protein